MGKRLNPQAPYFVQMRELERRLILSALEATELPPGGPQIRLAAGFLGVHSTYIRVRSRVLGGVFEGEPRCEPPKMTATEIWGEENSKDRTRAPNSRPRRPPAAAPLPLPPTKPATAHKLEIVKDDEPNPA